MDKLMNESVLTLDKEARVVGESSTGVSMNTNFILNLSYSVFHAAHKFFQRVIPGNFSLGY